MRRLLTDNDFPSSTDSKPFRMASSSAIVLSGIPKFKGDIASVKSSVTRLLSLSKSSSEMHFRYSCTILTCRDGEEGKT